MARCAHGWPCVLGSPGCAALEMTTSAPPAWPCPLAPDPYAIKGGQQCTTAQEQAKAHTSTSTLKHELRRVLLLEIVHSTSASTSTSTCAQAPLVLEHGMVCLSCIMVPWYQGSTLRPESGLFKGFLGGGSESGLASPDCPEIFAPENYPTSVVDSGQGKRLSPDTRSFPTRICA